MTPNYDQVIASGEAFLATLKANGADTQQGLLAFQMQVSDILKGLRMYQASARMVVGSPSRDWTQMHQGRV